MLKGTKMLESTKNFINSKKEKVTILKRILKLIPKGLPPDVK